VDVVDDYAHHPTEIRATLAAARTAFPGRRLVAAFQPHLFSRTRDFAREFGEALAAADSVFVADVDPAREAGGQVAWQGERAQLSGELARAVRSGDVVLTIGAGDITRTGPELLQALGG
jgi:UDP-N-acetylmuramate--alanine ligase